MKKQALSLAVAIAGAYPAASNALSLGDIESNSNLNQPLRAQIELLSANAQEARQLQVRLAPSSVFNRVGIDRPAFLDSLKFSSAVKNGKPVILVSSDQPIAEPFVNFLLEVSWPNGQLLKEYTVMLDPPVLMQPGNQLAGNEAAVRAEPRSTGVVNRPEPQQQAPARQRQVVAPQPSAQQEQQEQIQAQAAPRRQVQQARPAPARQQARASSGSRTYRVRSGDTLFKIATRLNQPGTNTDQMMMALYRANPQAFIDNNINGLKIGSAIKSPASSAAQNVSRAEARRQVRQHYTDWKNFRGTLAKNTVPQKSASGSKSSGPSDRSPAASQASDDKARLEVLGSKDKAVASDNVSAAGKQRLADMEKELSLARESLVSNQHSNEELKSKVDELESMLRKKNRLIALRDDQLAELQKQLAGGSGSVAAVQQPQTTEQAAIPVNSDGAAEPIQQEPIQQEPIQQEPANDRPLVDSTVQTPDAAGDIQNYVGNTAGQDNTVVRAQPQVTETNQANMTPAQRAAAAAATLNNNGSDIVREPEIVPPLNESVQTLEPAKPAASPFAEKTEGNDLMSMLTSPLAWKIGAGALLSLLLLGLLSRLLGRRKSAPAKHAEFDDEHFGLDDPHLSSTDVSHDMAYGDLESQLDKAESGKTAFNDPFGTHDTRGLMGTDPAEKDLSPVKADHEDDEVLMEANVYIAYGLHQQAESELKKALEKYPERLEYRHKLLENYFAANNREAFDQNALAVLETKGADRNGKLWQDIAGWGNKISPDNSMYIVDGAGKKGLGGGLLAAGGAAAAAVAGAATTAVVSGKSALNEGKDALSNAFDGTPNLNAGRPDLNVTDDLDLGLGGLSDDDLGMDDFDFDLDDLERELGAGDNDFADHQVVAPAVARPAVAEVGHDDLHEMANTVADTDLDFNMDDFAHELQSDAATKAGLSSNSSRDMDDFDLDEPMGESLSTAAKGLVGSSDLPDLADDAIDFNFGDDAKPVVAAAQGHDVLDFDLDSLTMEEPETSKAGKVAGMAAAAAGVAGAAVAAVGQKTAEATNKVTNLNLHLDKESGIKKILPQDTFYTKPDEVVSADDDWLGDIDDALSFLDMPDEEIDLHEAHISTKLDLARAYLDMGDIEGARSTLEEVMVEGNDNQRREAETLLHQTG